MIKNVTYILSGFLELRSSYKDLDISQLQNLKVFIEIFLKYISCYVGYSEYALVPTFVRVCFSKSCFTENCRGIIGMD